jgi:hypothetical protein
MRMDMDEAVENGFINPAYHLRMNPEEEDDHDRGSVNDKIPEVLTCRHQVSQNRVARLEERAAYAKYLILPTEILSQLLVE